MARQKKFVCEGCVAVAFAPWPDGWVGYGTSARSASKSTKVAHWCALCQENRTMIRASQTTRRRAIQNAKERGIFQKLMDA